MEFAGGNKEFAGENKDWAIHKYRRQKSDDHWQDFSLHRAAEAPNDTDKSPAEHLKRSPWSL